MDSLKDKYFPVLDNGFCAVVDWMGNDAAIARAARCSYGQGTKKVSDDRGLIRTLMRDMHTSPFEMCEVVLHVGLPIFVARQWVRHRTASLNEYSGRYSVMPQIFYTPDKNRHQTQDQSNKQGSTDQLVSKYDQSRIDSGRGRARNTSVDLYQTCLRADLSRELARIDLPLSTYTYWYWKIDLKNLLHFLRLRLDTHAQWEIREYAKVIAGMVQHWLPITWEAFDDYVLNGTSFSRQEQIVLLDVLRMVDFNLSDRTDRELIEMNCRDLGMSVRETKAFFSKVEFLGGQFTESVDLDMTKAKSPEFYAQMMQDNAVKV